MEKLKIFQKNKEYFRHLGINLNADTDTSHTFSRRVLLGLFTFALGVIGDFIYVIIYEANTFWELIQSIYFCYLAIVIPISYALLVFRAQILLEFTVNIENVVNDSKLDFEIEIVLFLIAKMIIFPKIVPLALLCYPVSKALIDGTNRHVEMMTKIIHFIFVYVTPMCGIVPQFFGIYFTYFTTDLGAEAFELPCPMW